MEENKNFTLNFNNKNISDEEIIQEEKTSEESYVENKIKKILITGASGYLGSYCVLQCLNKGYFVRAQIRNMTQIEFYNATKCFPNREKLEILKCELTNHEQVKEILQGVDCIINCAFHYDDNSNNEMSVIYPCIESLLTLLHKSKELNIKRFIHISCAETIYGGKYKPFYNEFNWANPDHIGINEKAKFFSEKAGKYFYEQNKEKIDYTTFNPGLLIGKPIKGFKIGRSSKWISYLMDEETKYIMKLKVPWISVIDTAKIIVDSIENKKTIGERYILSQSTYYLDDLNELLKKEYSKYNYNLNKKQISKFKIWILSFFDSNINNILPFYGKDYKLLDDKIRELYRLDYKPIDESISEMIHYLIEENQIEKKGDIMEDLMDSKTISENSEENDAIVKKNFELSIND